MLVLLAVAGGALSCGDGPTGPKFEITTGATPNGIVGDAYSLSLVASGGSRTKTWVVVSGALPSGLTLLASGALSGTPTTPGTFTFDVRVTSGGKKRTKRLTLTVIPRLATVASASVVGVVGAAYRDSLSASGGVGSYVWDLTAGQLPAGLSLASAGVVTGTPTAAGSAAATVRVTSGTQSATRELTITVVGALEVVSTTLAEAVVGLAYSDTVRASGGVTPRTWDVASGALPTGLVLFQNGAIGGTPTATGSGTFTARVTAGAQQTTRGFTLVVAAPLAMTTLTLPSGTQGDAYTATLLASGGTGVFAWSVTDGVLPAGLTLSTAGVLSGTLTAAGASSFTLRVSSGAQIVDRGFSVMIAPALAVLTDSLREGIVGMAYADTLRATGTAGAFSWGVQSGALPAGLTLLSNGTLSGTPTTAGTSAFTVQVTSGLQTATRALSVTIVPALVLVTPSLANATVGNPYVQQVVASGGIGAYAWSVVAGSIPAGLTFDTTGAFSGTPTTPSVNVFTLRARSGAQLAERQFTVQVSPSDPASVEITPAAASVELADSTTLVAAAKDAGAVTLPGRPIAWTTLNASVATVSGTGVVRGITLGTVGIVATTPGIGGVPVADTATITVIPVPVDSVEVQPGSASLLLGEVQPFTTVLRDRNNNLLAGRTVTWASSDAAVAAIDVNTGVVTSGVSGSATITALSEGVTGTATVLVSRGMLLTAVAGGERHSCGLTEAGLVFCWGRNLEGQLGDSSTIDRLRPVRARGTATYTSVSVGGRHNCALTSVGVAYCWGSNSGGRLGTADSTSRLTPTPVVGGLTFASIVAGGTQSCGLTSTGTAYCWGLNGNGQLGDNTQFSRNQPTLVAGGLSFTSLSAGTLHTCGIAVSGAAYCWGANAFSQVGDSTTGGNRTAPALVRGGHTWASISAGNSHTCGITTLGASYCWGLNGTTVGNTGRLGDGTNTSQRNFPNPVATGGLTFTQILAGGVHSCARTGSGALYCWGQNDGGQIGDATNTTSLAPVQVSGAFAWDAFGIGVFHSCAIRDLGRTFCWGQNLQGAIGDATTVPRNTPAPVRP
ncbi:MAG: putative Ig domain-containing protein [Gemmatimonadaceae bacterium]